MTFRTASWLFINLQPTNSKVDVKEPLAGLSRVIRNHHAVSVLDCFIRTVAEFSILSVAPAVFARTTTENGYIANYHFLKTSEPVPLWDAFLICSLFASRKFMEPSTFTFLCGEPGELALFLPFSSSPFFRFSRCGSALLKTSRCPSGISTLFRECEMSFVWMCLKVVSGWELSSVLKRDNDGGLGLCSKNTAILYFDGFT